MNKLLAVAALVEAATGMALVVAPSLVGRLLLGVELSGVSVVIDRMTGIALIALGVACWPGRTTLCGMLTYSALARGYLAWLGIRGEWVGSFLRPAMVVHAVIAIILGRAWLASPRTGGRNNEAGESRK